MVYPNFRLLDVLRCGRMLDLEVGAADEGLLYVPMFSCNNKPAFQRQRGQQAERTPPPPTAVGAPPASTEVTNNEVPSDQPYVVDLRGMLTTIIVVAKAAARRTRSKINMWAPYDDLQVSAKTINVI